MKLSLKYLFLCVLVCTHFCSCMYFQSNSRLRASYSCKPYQHIAANGFEIFDFSPSYFIILENNEMHTKSVVVKKELRLDPTSLKGTLRSFSVIYSRFARMFYYGLLFCRQWVT